MSLYGFLSFRTMITPSVLLIVYYLGAAGMPLITYGLFRKYFTGKKSETGAGEKENTRHSDDSGWSWKLKLILLLFFLMGELAWRIFIEFFVAYFQIRDALVG